MPPLSRPAVRSLRPARPASRATHRHGSVAVPRGTLRSLDSLTASGVRVRKRGASDFRLLVRPWQIQALHCYDTIGEVNYAAQFYARAMKRATLFVGEWDDDGDLVASENEDAIKLLDRIQDPGGGGRTQMQASYGRLKFLTGETYLTVTKGADGVEQWESLSSQELRINGDGLYTRFRSSSLTPEELRDPPDESFEPLEGEAVVYRLWNRHPRYSWEPDSPMQAVIGTLEELALLRLTVRSRLKSRAVGPGILLVPEQVSSTPPEPVGDEDPKNDIFLDDLIEALTAPIENPGSAAAVAPMLVRGDAEALKEFRHIQLANPEETYPERQLRDELVISFARAIDMPPEMLLGMTDANHWTGWQIDEASAKLHIFPALQDLVDDITSAYFRPALKEEGVQNWERLCVAYDASEIVNHPNRTNDAKDAHDRIVISDEAYRGTLGFSEEDAPDDEEANRRIGIKLNDPGLAIYGEPTLRQGAEIETGPADVEVPPEAAPADSGEVTPAIPETKDDVAGSLAPRVSGACDVAFFRCRELAGSRLRTLATKNHVGDGVENHALPAILGADLTDRAPLELVAGGAAGLAVTLRGWGLTRDHAGEIAALVEHHAAQTLYEKEPPAVPVELVASLAADVAA